MPTDPIKQPQRLWPRWLIAGSKPVRVDLGPAGSGVLVDIGGGGIRVQSLAPLKRAAEVPVRLEIPDKYEAIQCLGIVVWSKPNGAAGIRFTSISESQKANLRSWLEDLERAATSPTDPQQYDEFTSVVSKIRAAQLNNADALNFILRRVSEVSAATGAAIALGTPENMVCLAAVGIPTEVGTQIPPGKGLTSECVLRRKMIHCQNTKNDPRIGANAAFGSAVILPLLVGGEVRGTLEAYSPRTYSFDSTAIDNLEKLADAVVFVTYGIVTQRRLAAAKSPNPPASAATSAPKPMPAPPVPRAVPAAPKPQTTQLTDFTLTSIAAQNVSPASPTIVTSAAPAPAAPVAPAPRAVSTPRTSYSANARTVITDRVEPPRRQPPRSSVPRFLEAPQPSHSSAGKWAVAVVVLVVIASVSVWYFKLRVKPSTASAPVASVNADVEAAPVQSVVEQPTMTVTAEPLPGAPAVSQAAPPAHAPVSTSSTTPSQPSTETAKNAIPAPKSDSKAGLKQEKKTAEAPQPAAIVLSANVERRPAMREPEMLPVSGQIAVTPKMPAVSLPATAAAPKLAASAVSTRSGGNLVKRVDPVYPQRARSLGLQGDVKLHLRIGKDGSVVDIQRVSGNAILADAASDAVRRWKYDPLTLNGHAVEFETNVTLKFDFGR